MSVDTDLLLQSEGVLGRFRLLSFLGKGEHATVFRAFDPILERDVALKVPRGGRLSSSKVFDRFLGEAKALARLRHPRIVRFIELAVLVVATTSPWRSLRVAVWLSDWLTAR